MSVAAAIVLSCLRTFVTVSCIIQTYFESPNVILIKSDFYEFLQPLLFNSPGKVVYTFMLLCVFEVATLTCETP